MSISTKKIHPVVLIIMVVVGLYIAYQILVFFVKLFVYLGYNTIFYTDNLLKIAPFNPIISWAFLGLLIGAITGVVVAVRKFNLSKVLILYPLGFLLLFVVTMGLINRPAQYSTYVYMPPEPTPSDAPTPSVSPPTFPYIAKQDVNVRQDLSVNSPIAFQLRKGQRVDVLDNGILASDRSLWARVRYNGMEGYVRIKYFRKVR